MFYNKTIPKVDRILQYFMQYTKFNKMLINDITKKLDEEFTDHQIKYKEGNILTREYD